MSRQHERTIREVVESLGLKLVELERANSGHYRGTIETPDGRRRTYSFPYSPSDFRWRLNCRADLRRIAAGT
jgi:hypothetical protein